MKKFVLLFSFLFVVSMAFGQLLINEVDADQTGTDSVEFIELYDGGAGNTSLDGYVIVLFNGSDDQSYSPAYDLDGYSTDANGYFVIGSSLVPNVDYDLGLLTNIIQNGADAVALYTGDATDFPNDTPVTTTNLVDALVYDTNDPDDAGLLVLLNASEPQVNEAGGGSSTTESMQRSPNGSGGARNTSTYATYTPTPGTENPSPPTTATLTRAYSISGTAMDVVYDISITSVEPGDYSLTGTASITFSGASIDGTDDTIVHLTGASAGMVTDLTLDNIDDTSSNLDFYAGIMPISNSNTNNPTRATMLNDYDATFTGIISANDAYNNVWISDASGAYNGVMIFSSSFDALVSVGDEVLIAAQRDIYNGLTELINPILISTISTGNTPYGPTVINGSDINETIGADTNPAESWEGQLVKIENFYVESSGSYYYRCTDDGGTTYFYVGDNVDYHFGDFSLTVGLTYQEIVGVVDWYNSGPYYRINPRNNDDQTLPVTLSSFTAQFIGSLPILCWTTQSETNNSGWNVYRGESADASINGSAIQINSELITGAGTTTLPTDYVFEDEYETIAGNEYWYFLESMDYSGETFIHGSVSLVIPEEGTTPELPQLTILKNNYPNPFNPDTTIYFSVKENETAQLSIFNAKGQIIETKTFEAGIHNYFWDASDFASGIYLYQLETESFSEVRKMILLK